jgi:hypothetical protein
VDALSAGHNANGAVPIDPQTGKPFSYRSYMLMSAAFTARVQAHVRRAVVSNAFAAGNAYFTKSTYLVDRVGSVAGEAEVWMQGGSWQVNVQMLIDNAHVGTGALINFNAKASALEQQREYITASFLIGRGHHQYLQFSDAGHKSFEQLSPLYRMPIGIPLRAYWRLADYFHHGVYRRYYTKGVAVANPGSKTVKFALGGRYKDVSGHVMTSVTLSAHSGIVLVRSR